MVSNFREIEALPNANLNTNTNSLLSSSPSDGGCQNHRDKLHRTVGVASYVRLFKTFDTIQKKEAPLVRGHPMQPCHPWQKSVATPLAATGAAGGRRLAGSAPPSLKALILDSFSCWARKDENWMSTNKKRVLKDWRMQMEDGRRGTSVIT